MSRELLEAQRQIEQLEVALEHRGVIARAQGILMERYGIDDDAALALLKRLSSTHNIKVRDIAAELVETRTFPAEIVEREQPDRA